MQDILRHINSVEGVMGSAVFSEKGRVLSHTFPPLIDAAALKSAANLTIDCIHGLQIAQTLETFDMRYAEGRIIFRSFSGAIICLLCAKSINLQVLNITLNLAVKKLAALLPKAEEAAEAAAPTPVETVEDAGDSTVLRLKISRLANKEASSSFDSLGMIAVSAPTSSYISDFYRAAFKKLSLTNPVEGTNGIFPVMVMKDIDQQFDGTIIIGPGIEKKLKVTEGDKVEIRIG
jgi:predicted regulator of Ras-like GTPase activity (Roadblock/LC7/MglB family)